MWSLRALDLSHNTLSGQIPQNISKLAVLDLSYNSFSGLVPKKESYKRFPGAFAGNPHLCVEQCEGDDDARLPAMPWRSFGESMKEQPISVLWAFSLSVIVMLL
ncbi:Receptor-like protein CLAVATA2 [Linum perenne]